jgi:opacity protein-like surface antigen
MAAKGREGGKLTIIDGLGAIKWYVRPKQARATPYVTAGIGAFRMTDGDIVATNFAVGFGVGVDYEISRMLALFGELRYSSCLTSPSSTDFLPLRIGIMLKG